MDTVAGHITAIGAAFGRLAEIAKEAGKKIGGALGQVVSEAGNVFDAVGKGLSAFGDLAAKTAKQAGGSLLGMFQGLQQGVMGLHGALLPVTGVLTGFALRGIWASGAGQVMGFQLEEISRQIASLFVPQIMAVINGLARLVGWFQALSGEQQKQLRQWGLFAAGLTLTAMILPKVIAGAMGLITAFKGLKIALFALSAHPLVLIATVIAAIVIATVGWKNLLKGAMEIGRLLQEPFKDLLQVLKDIGGVLRDVRDVLASIPVPDWMKEVAKASTLFGALDNYKKVKEGFKEDTEQSQGEKWGRRLMLGVLSPVGLAVATYLGKKEKKPEEEEDRKELMGPSKGFEDSLNFWKRISQASIMSTAGLKTPAERQEEWLEKIYQTVQELNGMGRAMNPAIAR